MKDFTQSELEDGRPIIPVIEGIEFCLNQLYADKTHTITDDIVERFTFEELIGVLLLARDELKILNEG